MNGPPAVMARQVGMAMRQNNDVTTEAADVVALD
jgi:hypothetical protein